MGREGSTPSLSPRWAIPTTTLPVMPDRTSLIIVDAFMGTPAHDMTALRRNRQTCSRHGYTDRGSLASKHMADQRGVHEL